MKVHKLEAPDTSGINESELINKYLGSYNEFFPLLRKVNEEKYLHWKELKHKTPPTGMSNKEFWVLTKVVRKLSSRPMPVQDEDGKPFMWYRQENLERLFRRMDMELGGRMVTTDYNPEKHQRFVARGVLEEAIASSQLEGASTTRKAAKQMIAEQRSPRNKSEQMIYNNYVTMQAIEDELAQHSLSTELLFDLHARLVDKTMDDPQEIGRFRRDDDKIVVQDRATGEIFHIPPKEAVLEKEIERLIAYANDDEGPFIHPIIKAIVLHFWVGFLHPFTDGNGRMARTLFYWYLLKHDYWMMTYVPISTVIKRAPIQYSNAYVHSEQDDRDITYFISYHIDRLVKAMDELKEYIAKIDAENRQIDQLTGPKYALNDRQKQLLHHLVAGEGAYATITTHQTLNGISRLTADRDLKYLTQKELTTAIKVGRTYQFYASEKLRSALKKKNPIS